MTKLCECNHPKNFHNEVGCGGVVELRTTAIVKHAACDCKSYRPSPPAEPKCEQLVAKGGTMNIEQIKERITEIRKLSNEILAGKESQEKNR